MKLNEIHNTKLTEGLGDIDFLAVDLLNYGKKIEIRVRNIPEIRIPSTHRPAEPMLFKEIEKHLNLTKNEEEALYYYFYGDENDKNHKKAPHYIEINEKLKELTLAFVNLLHSLGVEYVEKDKLIIEEFFNDVRSGDDELIRRKYLR